eukprot:2291317-Pleurochrysis_carterae.AAC.1
MVSEATPIATDMDMSSSKFKTGCQLVLCAKPHASCVHVLALACVLVYARVLMCAGGGGRVSARACANKAGHASVRLSAPLSW